MSVTVPKNKKEETASKTDFEKALERKTGETIQQLRDTPIDEHRKKVEGKLHRLMRFVTRWPAIGRGNVMHDRIVSEEDLNKRVDKALR